MIDTISPETDAGRMALCVAIRRDWRPAPVTLPWTPAMQVVLFEVAVEIENRAREQHYAAQEMPL